MRLTLPLNNHWRYLDQNPEGFESEDFSDSHYEKVRIPHSNREMPLEYLQEKDFQYISTYRLIFDLPSEGRGKVQRLHFEGVMTKAEVFLNGKFLGEHRGGYTPFSFDIEDICRPGEKNLLAVRVDSRELADIPPFGGVIDYLTYGGIYREVWLEILEPLHLKDAFVRGEIDPSTTIRADLELNCPADRNLKVTAQLIKPATSRCEGSEEVLLELDEEFPAGSRKIQLERDFPLGELWDCENPHLYELHWSLDGGDFLVSRFGFRKAEFKKKGFYLNHRPLKIRGLNHHQSFPFTGYAMPRSAQWADADMLKDHLQVNLVRLSHYPHSRHFLDRCDEIGLMTFEEIPGWQHLGGAEWKELVKENVREMILRDRNRPSLVIWGVRVNESIDEDELYTATNDLAHSLDDTRATGGVRYMQNSHLLEDVYTYNDFIHTGSSVPLEHPDKTAGVKNVPYLVTEHNGHMFPTKKTDNESRRIEQAIRHTRVLNHMYGEKRISGAIGWCMFDYNTHRDFGSGDRICHHGVQDIFRIDKFAAAAYASQGDKPFGFVASEMNIGDRDASALGKVWVFTNCDRVRLYMNGEFLGDFFPDYRRFPHLPHPPVLVDDFLGNRLRDGENFSRRDAARIKKGFLEQSHTGRMGLRNKLRIGWVLLKNRLPLSHGYSLFTKYMSTWGTESLCYTFEGYDGITKEWAINKGTVEDSRLLLLPDSTTLQEGDTWDCTRVVLKAIGQFGQPLTYSSEPLQIQVEGAGERIGPELRCLQGGSTAVWVKTTGVSGTIRVMVRSSRWGVVQTELTVTSP